MSTEAGLQVHIQKEFSVPKEELYRAWTEPQELMNWWKPMNKQLTEVRNELELSGAVEYFFGNELQIRGTYKEVVKGERLKYSWNWETPDESLHKGAYLLTVEFKESDNGSQLEITQENFKSEHSIQPHQEGWESGLEDLKNYLEQKRS